MEIDYKDDKIVFDKVLNSLDRLAIDFCSVLERLNIRYVLISGYVSILFGRSRASEDIDLFIERIGLEKFKELWKALGERFECLNTNIIDEAYHEYLETRTALRFSRKGVYLPNMEVKFVKETIDLSALNNRIGVIVNEKMLYVSPLELQIAFKLKLGSEKDIEDAIHLYEVFKEHLDEENLRRFFDKFNIKEDLQRTLHGNP